MKDSVSPTTTANMYVSVNNKSRTRQNLKFPLQWGEAVALQNHDGKEHPRLHGAVRYGHVFCAFHGQAAHLDFRGSQQVMREATS